MINIKKNAIIIPTLEPGNGIIKLVLELQQFKLNEIIIIDDGSGSEYNYIFKRLEELKCIVIHHSVNLGKGEAIKTGIKYAFEHMNVDGYVTADSDNQHSSFDINRVSNELIKTNNIVLGIRDFSSDNVPFKSYYGNKFSSMFFKFETGLKCVDTQTGLRGIPKRLTDFALLTNGSRYEYEMNFLISAAKNNYKIETINIETIYENNNEVSHFRPFRDAVIIYKKPLKFIVSSLLSGFIDLFLFTLIIYFFVLGNYEVVLATIIARIISGIFNYEINNKWSFKNNIGNKKISKYIILFIIQMLLSSVLVYLLSSVSIFITFIKIIVDLSLFIISYVIQKKLIFKGSE